jgi:hypothetical protein
VNCAPIVCAAHNTMRKLSSLVLKHRDFSAADLPNLGPACFAPKHIGRDQWRPLRAENVVNFERLVHLAEPLGAVGRPAAAALIERQFQLA